MMGLLNGEPHTYYGALLAFLGGTVICLTNMSLVHNNPNRCFLESDCQLRNDETHFEQCSLLSGPLRDHYSTTFGINRLSVLEEVPGFSVVTSPRYNA